MDNLPVLISLLERGADPNLSDRLGWTPLIYANTRDFASALLRHGANVNKADKAGWTPLMYAVEEGNKSMVDFLLANDADISLRTNDGKTAEDIAVLNDHPFILAQEN